MNDRLEDGTTTYLSDSTAADYDLYTVQPLPFTPTAILGVDYRRHGGKIGCRCAHWRASNGIRSDHSNADHHHAEHKLTYYKYQIDLDPNTSGPWALANLNAIYR